tara:strand:- start:3218 stop:5134 length:1917 start_codon:yes stop_codon:yes gene_type:complete
VQVPIIFSNDGFYKNVSRLSQYSPVFQELIEALVREQENHTIPYRYNIVKDSNSYRQLSLLHPKNQLKIADFYREFDQLIIYYTSHSPFSIRYPEKVGSRYFFSTPHSNRNKFKNGTVDTTDIEKIVRNPASYFSYAGYGRLYRFFSSPDFVRLEKKFSSMLTLDVSKCFHSIYTHSISWALKDIKIAKTYRGPQTTFGNRFDSLMQSGNYNETNGISIGSETSRLFAEIILSRVDQNIETELNKRNLRHMVDYECKRYVDDYYVFSNSRETLNSVQRVISLCLSEFKLHLNDSKTEVIDRPIHTEKSNIINITNKNISKFIEKLIETKNVEGNRISIPKSTKNPSILVRYFIREIKDTCYQTNSGFESISNYVVSALSNRVIRLVESYLDGGEETKRLLHFYPRTFLVFLELMFFFFSMYPTCDSSLRLCRTLVLVGRFLNSHSPDDLENIREHSLRWSSQLLTAPTFTPLLKRQEFVPIELLNILVSLKELSRDAHFERPLIESATSLVRQDGYFDIVSRLYIFADNDVFKDLREELFQTIKKLLLNTDNLTQNSHDVHLLIDVLSCPHIPIEKRCDLLKALWPKIQRNTKTSLSSLHNVSFRTLIQEFESSSWFVDWQNIDLLNLIEKKELSSVY